MTLVLLGKSSRGSLIAVICLALMLVGLGAAAKHSQFETCSHSTHYLKQSVKMLSSEDHLDLPARAALDQAVVEILESIPAPPVPVSFAVAVLVPAPLLI